MGGREGERSMELSVHLVKHPSADSSMCPDRVGAPDLGGSGQHSNQLKYLARAISVSSVIFEFYNKYYQCLN